jgi:hypothetical protein
MTDEQRTPPTPDPPAPAITTSPTPPASELRDRAKELDVDGRSKMDRDELVAAIAAAEVAKAAREEEEARERTGTPKTAFADATAALFNDADVERPATPEETGRPELLEVAQERAARRASRSRTRN